MTPYPGTALHQRMSIEGRITETDWDLYDTRHVVYTPRAMSPTQLVDGYWRAYKDFYRWPKIISGARGQETTSAAIRHLLYAGGWKKFEPLWDRVIKTKRVAAILPLLEQTLDAFGRARHAPDAPPAVPIGETRRNAMIERAGTAQVDPVRGVPRRMGAGVVVPVEHRHRRPPLLPLGVDRVVGIDVLLADRVQREPDHVVNAALPERLHHDREAVPVRRGIVVVADEDHDVRPDRAAELAHRREDARRRIGGETAGQSQPPARMELEADPVSALDDPLRRRVPVERCPGGVGEDRHALVRPPLARVRGRREPATECDRGEQCQKAPHRAGL